MTEKESKYHIGTRLYGYPEKYVRALQGVLAKKFGLKDYNTKRTPPHMTFIRPFTTNNEEEVVEAFTETLAQREAPIIYEARGLNFFDNKPPVLYMEIARNEDINTLMRNLEKSLDPHIEYLFPKISLPGEETINLHTSVLAEQTEGLREEIIRTITEYPFSPVRQALLRVYLLKDKRILREFDVTSKNSLEREVAKNPFEFRKSQHRFEDQTGMMISAEGILLPLPHQ